MREILSNEQFDRIAADHFMLFARRQKVARLMALEELFKLSANIKGQIVECGVHIGGGVMSWLHLSSILEPYGYHRSIIGFDTFEGFPSVRQQDLAGVQIAGDFNEPWDTKMVLDAAISKADSDRPLGSISKVHLVVGDANVTIPKYVTENPELMISLLYLDFDIYEPTVTALKHLVPRMPKGAVLAFDELNNSHWPGETQALIESSIWPLKVKTFTYEPNISYALIE